MPESKAQVRFMGLCLHNPEHARGKCPPASVAREILNKSKGKRLPERKQPMTPKR